MIRSILLFLAFAISVTAQDFYVDTPVSTTQVTATNVTAGSISVSGTISGTTFTGSANGLTINAISATVSTPLLNMFGPIRDMTTLGPIKCDGQHHPENIYEFDRIAYRGGSTAPLNIANGPVGATCVYGMNAAVGAITYATVTTVGSGYTSPSIKVIGTGADCTSGTIFISPTIVGGKITAVSVTVAGSGCTQPYPTVSLTDPTGSGASITVVIDHPLYLYDNTMYHKQANNIYAINHSELFQLTNRWNKQTDTISNTNIITVGYPALAHDDSELRTLSQSRKVEGYKCNSCMMVNPTVSLTTDNGNFCLQYRDSQDWAVINPLCLMVPPSGSGISRDGFHFTGGNRNGVVINGRIKSIDDSLSGSIEDDDVKNRIADNIQVFGGTYQSRDHGGLKLFTGSGAYGTLQNVHLNGVEIGNWGTSRAGNCGHVEQHDGVIQNFSFNNVTCDGTFSEGQGGSSLFTINGDSSCGVRDGDLGNFRIKNVPYRAREYDAGTCNIRSKGMKIGPYISETVQASGVVVSATYSSSNVMRVDVTSNTSLAKACTAGTCYARLSGMSLDYNNTSGLITSVSDSAHFFLMTVTDISSSTNEINVSGTLSIVSRSGVWIYDRGSYGTRDEDLELVDAPQAAVQYTTANGATYGASSTVWINDTTAKVTISTTTGGTVGDLAVEKNSSGYATISGFVNSINNVTVAKILQVVTNTTPPYMLIRVPGRTSATDELTVTPVASLTTIYIPTDPVLINPRVTRQTQGNGIQIIAGMGVTLQSPECFNYAGNICVTESSGVNVSGTFMKDGLDHGQSRRTHRSWNMSDGQHLLTAWNIGTNSEYLENVPLNGVSTTYLNANIATVAGQLGVGAISATDATSRSMLMNVSATGSVSVTGSVSANKFIGDGSLLTSVTSVVAPAGGTGEFQTNGGGATSSTVGAQWVAATRTISITTGAIDANGVSGTRMMASNSGSCSSASVQVSAVNNGLTRPNSNQLGLCAGGTLFLAGTTTSVNTSLTMIVSGTQIQGSCNKGAVCGTAQVNAICTTSSTVYICDGLGSWGPAVVGTKVSATAFP